MSVTAASRAILGKGGDLECAHEALDAVASENAEQVVLQTQEVPRAAGVTLPAHHPPTTMIMGPP